MHHCRMINKKTLKTNNKEQERKGVGKRENKK